MKLRRLYSQTIFKQLVTFTLLISIIPVIVVSVLQFARMERMVEEELVNFHRQVISQYIKSVEEKLTQFQYSLNYIANNTIVQETMQSAEGNAYVKGKRISDEVIKSLLLEQRSEINSCMVYSLLLNRPIYGTRVSMMETAQREGWFQKDGSVNDGCYTYYAPGQKQVLLAMVQSIREIDLESYEQRTLGIVKLDLNVDSLFAPAEANDIRNFQVQLYNGEGDLLYTSVLLEQDLKQLAAQEEPEGQLGTFGEYIVYGQPLEEYGLKLLFLFETSELTRKRGEVIWWIMPAILVLILIIVVGALCYTRNFSQRVELLLRKFKNVESGDLQIREPMQGNDEIAALDREFGHMLEKLNHLIRCNYIQQLETKETQLRNLQLQINPHFLYNTLETISSIAAVNHSFVICDICEKLGEIFRYSLGKDYGEFVTVDQELHHTQNYIFIQKIRYGSRFEVFYSVEESLREKKILRFILQPIVENAIVHGLANLTGTGTLEISIREEEQQLVIKIADDGEGMDLQRLEELRAYIAAPGLGEEHKKSIGVRNVNQRIKMACGEQYGIRIESAPGQGSAFELWLPLL